MKKGYLGGAALIALALTPCAAMAQEVGAEQDGGLADIVVTAQRKVESAQKAAIPLAVVSTETLARAGVTDASTLNSVAPALTVSLAGGAANIYFIRGVGNFAFTPVADPAVATNIDGIYIARPTATHGAFFDLERIEVLKGPQGTLYGRNATGGAVNILPAKPVLGETSGAVSLGYGNYDAGDAEAHVNLALGDNAALRVSGKAIRADGYNSDGTNDNKSNAFRVQLLTRPTETLSVRLAADYARSFGVGAGGTFEGALHFAPGAPATPDAPANYAYEPANLDAREGLFSPGAKAFLARQVIGGSFNNPAPMVRPYRNDVVWGTLAEINAETAIGDVTFIPAYRESKQDHNLNGPAFSSGLEQDKDHQFSAELRLAGKSIGPVDWLIGGYYFDETTKGNASYNQYLVNSIQEYDIRTKSLAGFGRLTLHLSDTLRFVGAGRYTHDKKAIDANVITLLNVCTNAPPPSGPGCFGGPSIPMGLRLADVAAAIPASQLPFGFPAASGDGRPFGSSGNVLLYTPLTVNEQIKQNRFTYRLAVEADLGPRSLGYISYETGYRSGGFSVALGRETFKPEFIKAFTIGVKNRFLNNRLQVNVEGFHWKYSGQQVSHFGTDAAGLTSFFTDNAGSSTIKGADIDVQLQVTPTTVLSGSVQYLDSKLNDFVYETPRGPTSLPPAVGCAYAPEQNADGFDVYKVNCSGKSGLNSPKWSINGGIKQEFNVGDYRIVFTADGRYRSNAVIGFEYLSKQNSGENFTADTSISVGPQDERWTITGWIRNVGNRDVPTLVQFNGTVAGTLTNFYAPPRTYGIKASAKF